MDFFFRFFSEGCNRWRGDLRLATESTIHNTAPVTVLRSEEKEYKSGNKQLHSHIFPRGKLCHTSVRCSTFLFAVAMFESRRFSSSGGPRKATNKQTNTYICPKVLEWLSTHNLTKPLYQQTIGENAKECSGSLGGQTVHRGGGGGGGHCS